MTPFLTAAVRQKGHGVIVVVVVVGKIYYTWALGKTMYPLKCNILS